jgi:hypothetical protein
MGIFQSVRETMIEMEPFRTIDDLRSFSHSPRTRLPQITRVAILTCDIQKEEKGKISKKDCTADTTRRVLRRDRRRSKGV